MLKKLLGFIFIFAACGIFATSQAQTITISAPHDTVCSGTAVTFTPVVSTGTGYTFKWYINGVYVTSTTTSSSPYSTSTLVNGDVIICELYSGSTYVSLSNTITMTVEHIPVVATISGADTVCFGATVTLTDDTAGGSWNTSNPFVTSISSTGVVTGIRRAGLDTITYSLTNMCGSDTAMIPMYVATPPVVDPVVGPATLCLGTAHLYVDSTAGGTWSLTNTTATITATAGLTVRLTAGSTVGADTLIYMVTNGCGTTTRSKLINIASTPVVGPIIPFIGNNPLCQDSTLVLTDMSPGGMWSFQTPGIVNILGGFGAYEGIQGLSAGTTNVVYTVNNGCGVDSQFLMVTVIAGPVVYPIIAPRDSICPSGTEALLEYATGGTWSSSNTGVITVDGSGNVTGVAAGTATISYSASNECGTVSASVTIAVYCPYNVGVPIVPASKEITIYPNPAHDIFTIQGTDAALVQVVNMYGQTVSTLRNTNAVSVSNLPDGLYVVTVLDVNGNVVAKQQIVKM